jgi:hypothetical protein
VNAPSLVIAYTPKSGTNNVYCCFLVLARRSRTDRNKLVRDEYQSPTDHDVSGLLSLERNRRERRSQRKELNVVVPLPVGGDGLF